MRPASVLRPSVSRR
ncbi:hypothetical protein YPPY71_2720, partial [Yersinia pestis PY-71]